MSFLIYINVVSVLENYQKLELEKKKNRIKKDIHKGPLIKMQSVAMPLVQELPEEISVDIDR